MKRFLVLASFAALNAADPTAIRQDGLAALGRGDWATAATAFDRVVAERPGDADAWVLLGIARWHQGRNDEALAALDRALRHMPTLASRAHYYRALALTALGRDDDAAAAFAVLVERFPRSEEALRVRAAIEPVGGRSEPAETETVRTWRFDAGLSLIHDSNPDRLNPALVEDPRADRLTDAFATLRWTSRSRRLGILAAGRSEDYVRRDDLDALVAQGRFWIGVLADQQDELRIGASSTRSWLGHAPFRWRHAVEAGWWHALDGNRSISGEGSIATTRHDQEEDVALDGTEYRADAGLRWDADAPGLLRSVEGRLGIGNGSAARRDLASTQVDGLCDIGWRPAMDWLVRWSAEGGVRLFGQDSGERRGERRTDTWAGTGLSLEWQPIPWGTIALHGYGERTWSNVELYAYDLLLISAQIRVAW